MADAIAVTLTERTGVEIVQVAAWPATHDDTVRLLAGILGVVLPGHPGAVASRGDASILAAAPGRWLIVRPAESSQGGAPLGGGPLGAQLASALPKDSAAVLELSASRRIFIVSGPRSRDLLAKYLPLDLSGSELTAGHCAHSAMAHIGVLVHVRGDEVFELYVTRSFAQHLWDILVDASVEFADPSDQSLGAPAEIHDSI